MMYMFKDVGSNYRTLETPGARFRRLTAVMETPVEAASFSAFCGVCEIFVFIDPSSSWCPYCQKVLSA